MSSSPAGVGANPKAQRGQSRKDIARKDAKHAKGRRGILDDLLRHGSPPRPQRGVGQGVTLCARGPPPSLPPLGGGMRTARPTCATTA